ncbi:MAG: hypothetical protein KBG85_17195 [Micropruina sp.]|nr:hypothetical protein [Micropruina sp.]
MTLLVALGVVLALLMLAAARRRPRRARLAAAQPVPAGFALTESDAAELQAVARSVELEMGTAPVQLLLIRIGNVARRRVPVRAVRPGPVRGLARICFADGTTVQARGRHVGDLGSLAISAMSQRVLVSDFHADDRNVVVDLGWPRGRVSVLAVGLDQAD